MSNRIHIAEGIGHWFKFMVIGTVIIYSVKAAYNWATKKEGTQ